VLRDRALRSRLARERAQQFRSPHVARGSKILSCSAAHLFGRPRQASTIAVIINLVIRAGEFLCANAQRLF
jgi:hypothetical protein